MSVEYDTEREEFEWTIPETYAIPEEPGLGVTLDVDVVAEQAIEGEEVFDEE